MNSEPDNRAFAKAFRFKRMGLGLERKQLAEVLGISEIYIKHTELGLVVPSDKILIDMDKISRVKTLKGLGQVLPILKKESLTSVDIIGLSRAMSKTSILKLSKILQENKQ